MVGLVADLVAVAHLAAVVFLLGGGLLSWRWPALVWVHLPLAGTILAVNLAGLDCPLTTLELDLRARSGEPGYSGGFISHYLVEPVHPAGITPGVQLGIYLAAIAPNVVAYHRHLTRRLRSVRPRPTPSSPGATVGGRR